MAQPVQSKFEIISGSGNVILVAPHGHQKDDENTGALARHIREHLNCYAVINEIYRRPDEDKGEQTNRGKHIANLNDIDSIKKANLKADWLDKIDGFRKGILTGGKKAVAHDKCYVFLIHGAEDDNVKVVNAEAHVLIGVGRQHPGPLWKDRLTADTATVDAFINALSEAKMTAAVATAGEPNSTDIEHRYAAWDKHNLNQLFTPRNPAYNDDKVESFQLEFKKTDIRDTPENIKATAENLAKAIRKLSGIVVQQLPEEEGIIQGEIIPPVESKAENNLPQPAEGQPDDALVDEAYKKLQDIFIKHYENARGYALLEAGHYIIKTFFNGDIELAKKRKPVQDQAYTQLLKRLQDQNEDSPRKSWLDNAVKLVVLEHDYKNVHALGKLNTTQKLLLLPVPAERKQEMAEEAVKKGYTTRELADRIRGMKKVRKASLLFLLKKPEVLFTEENSPLISKAALEAMNPATISKIKEAVAEQVKKIQTDISELRSYAEQYEALAGDIEATEQADNNEQDQGSDKMFGTWEWAAKTVNITTGCLNDCRYCYARYDAINRHDRVNEGEWSKMVCREGDVFKRRRKYDGTVMFPSSHDIVPENLYACTIVLENLLKVGNRVLIVSKPRLECIERLCKYFKYYKDQILFRFTIGATDNEILKFWEPNAPSYEERKACLKLAFDHKFETSVSSEPMLDSAHIDDLIQDLQPFITDAHWVGKLNKIKSRVQVADELTAAEVKKIEDGQTDEIIKAIYERHKDNPKVKWKESIKKIVGIEEAKEAGLDQ